MMYLLLRDNKQSGPYSLEELKVKGLKAYDLVWVEGRSAAWRYPSEVEELRSFAPAVEEQPFDRFFKRPAAANQASTSEMPVNTTAVTMTQPSSSSNPTTTKRTIYVTMPGGIAPRETTPVRQSSPSFEVAPVREVAAAREVSPVRETMPVREAVPVRERVSYGQEPVSEILPPLPRRKPVKIWFPVAIGSGILVLLAAGIFIGLSLQKDSSGSLKLASKDKGQAITRTPAQQLPVSSPTIASPAPNKTAAQTAPTPTTSIGPAGTATETDKPVNRPRVSAPRQKTDVAKSAAVVPAVTTTDSQIVQQAPHREAIHRTDAVQSQPVDNHEALKAALANEVSVGTNKYEVGTFGGIHNLQVTVTNRSGYSLDLVVVTVSYIQANKKTYKTENLYFRGIGPGSALMLEAPKSPRGVTIEYKVTSINSKELGSSEPGT